MRVLLTYGLVFLAGFSPATRAANSVLSLSHYDEKAMDFLGMHREGLEGVIHEATYPAEHDPKYAFRQNQAARAGLQWGAYHFGNGTDGKKQADYFLNFVSSAWVKGSVASASPGVLLVLDAEQNTHYPGGSMRVDQAVRFVERVRERTGGYPGLYSNENWIKRLFNSPAVDAASRQVLSKCWLWIANYHVEPASTAPWARWTLWQYTGDGICGLPRMKYPTSFGNLRKVERTIFSGDRAALRHFWNEHAWSPERTLLVKSD